MFEPLMNHAKSIVQRTQKYCNVFVKATVSHFVLITIQRCADQLIVQPLPWMGHILVHAKECADHYNKDPEREAHNSLVVRKRVFGVSDQVPHKPGCTAT